MKRHNVLMMLLGAAPVAVYGAQPNVIYIIADDLGYGDLGCYGQQLIRTPNIDRMAANGMRFTQHYAGCTVSAPSRSSLMTGLHTGHTPIRGNREVMPEGQYPLPEGTLTIGRMMQQAGYATGCFGKWGLGYPGSTGEPNKQGFDRFYGYNCQRLAHNYYPYHLWSDTTKVMLAGNEGQGRAQYSQDLIQRQALDFIRANRGGPFFAMMTYVIPHAELTTPRDSIIASYDGRFSETPYRGVDHGPGFKDGYYGSTPHPKADFAAMITRLDAYVGQIAELVDSLGIGRNTIIIFTSDNGPHREGGADPDFFRSYGPLRGVKRDLYEGGIRVPMVVRWPGTVAPGRESEHISAFWDMMPTLAELATGQTVAATDGISLVPTLTGRGAQPRHDHLYWEFHEMGGRVAVRRGDWKLVRLNVNDPEAEITELYDLSKDPAEQHNIASKHPSVVKRLTELSRRDHVDSPTFPMKVK